MQRTIISTTNKQLFVSLYDTIATYPYMSRTLFTNDTSMSSLLASYVLLLNNSEIYLN